MKPSGNDKHRPQRRRYWGGRQSAVPTLARQQGHRLHPGRRPNNTAGNAERNHERYLALAREAASKGDTIEMENCYQHAEHYFRLMRAAGPTDE
jgi:hypothetical protein